jgi:hypothetical protein
MELSNNNTGHAPLWSRDRSERIRSRMSDLNDRWPHDDPDVIEIKQAIALVPIDVARIAANIRRDADADDGGDLGVAPNGAAPPSSGTRDLAAMVMFDLDVER